MLPDWGDTSCEPADFHAVAAHAELRIAYPFRPQEWLALDLAAGVGVRRVGHPGAAAARAAGWPWRRCRAPLAAASGPSARVVELDHALLLRAVPAAGHQALRARVG